MTLCKSEENGKPCEAEATVTVFWPGRTTAACDRHARGMERLAEAMGFQVDKRPIGTVEPGVTEAGS